MHALVRIAAGAFLIAHGLVHLLYVTPSPKDPNFPFTLKESWLVPQDSRRPTGLVLMVAVVVAFALLGLAIWGFPGLSDIWPALAIVAAALSLTLLFAFWNARLVAGIGIDAALIALALAQPGWLDKIVG